MPPSRGEFVMATKSGGRKHHRTWDEQLVTVIGDRVQIAIDYSPQGTVSAVAKHLANEGVVGASQQTLHYIVSGKNKTELAQTPAITLLGIAVCGQSSVFWVQMENGTTTSITISQSIDSLAVVPRSPTGKVASEIKSFQGADRKATTMCGLDL